MPLRLKACARCGGDLSLEKDLGNYSSWTCIQCGHAQESDGVPTGGHSNGDLRYNESRGRTAPKRGINARGGR